VDVLHHGPGQRQAVVGGGAAADLVEHHELRAVAVFRITAVSVISTMNVDRPRARLSGRADAREDAVDQGSSALSAARTSPSAP
jgi:hypothetical protein